MDRLATTTSAGSIDLVWILFCTVLVLLMQAGFLCLESGAVRRKNSVNVAVKNVLDLCVAALMFFLVGFSLAYGETLGGWLGELKIGLATSTPEDLAHFLFLLVFCGTAVTIISGAIAERTTLAGYLLIACVTSALIYPVFCHWVWGDGWLAQLGFVDFAGSTVVHATGGWLALVACVIIGPRLGFRRGHAMPAYNLTFSALGTLLLWIGWLGFNGGSLLAFNDRVPGILVNTMLASVAGGLVTMAIAFLSRMPLRFEFMVVGVISSLVGVTASAHAASAAGALMIGGIAAAIGLWAHRQLALHGIDDVVGAIAAHAIAGVVGTLAVPFVSSAELLGTGLSVWQQAAVQLLGVTANFAWCVVVGGGLLWLCNKMMPLRSSKLAEQQGLDVSEHDARNALYELGQQIQAQGLPSQKLVMDEHTEEGVLAAQFEQINRAKQSAYASKDRADRANEAKSKFLANMSHELRTPLNGILGTLEVVMQDKLDDELRENLHMAQNSSEHLLVLLNDLLDTAKLEAGEIELESNPTSIKEVVQTVCNTFMHAAVQKGIELQASIDTQAPDYVLTDPTRLKQILMNLVGNAIKFTSAGGVEVKVITAEVEDGLQRLQFAVADSGVGIAADAVDTIFERFKQADGSTTRNFGGTGLGLALCKDLTELMGGSIHVTSELGQGSVFTVDIPFQVTTGQPSDVSAQTAQSQLGLSQARILVAEDNQTNQIVVKKLLQKLGFEYIDIVADGQAALDRWLAQGYDIILMDCQMPGMDGLEATTRIREEERSRKASPVPIIAVTANASMLEQQECLDAGMSDHLSKPLRLRSLADMMLQYLQADESPAERAS